MTDAEWQTRTPRDGRKVGVIVHHVATMYPIEIQLAQQLAADEAIALLERNSAFAARAIRAFFAASSRARSFTSRSAS